MKLNRVRETTESAWAERVQRNEVLFSFDAQIDKIRIEFLRKHRHQQKLVELLVELQAHGVMKMLNNILDNGVLFHHSASPSTSSLNEFEHMLAEFHPVVAQCVANECVFSAEEQFLCRFLEIVQSQTALLLSMDAESKISAECSPMLQLHVS